PWAASQSAERLHHLTGGSEDNFVHDLPFPLAGVSIEIDPASIRAKHEHARLWYLSRRRNASLRDQVRACASLGTEVQNLRVLIVVGDSSHQPALRRRASGAVLSIERAGSKHGRPGNFHFILKLPSPRRRDSSGRFGLGSK